MLRRIPCIGMNKEQVSITLDNPADKISDEVDNKETWVYGEYEPLIEKTLEYCVSVPIFRDTRWLSFENDKLVRIETIQDRIERQRKQKIDKYIKEHPECSQFKDSILENKIWIGMGQEESFTILGDAERCAQEY